MFLCDFFLLILLYTLSGILGLALASSLRIIVQSFQDRDCRKPPFFGCQNWGGGVFFGGGGVSPKIVHYPPGGGGSLRKMSKNGLFSGFFYQNCRPRERSGAKSFENMFRAGKHFGTKRNRKKQHFFQKVSKSPQRLLYFWGVFCPTAR